MTEECKDDLVVAIRRRRPGEPREFPLMWDTDKVLKRLSGRIIEEYYRSKGFKRRKTLDKFLAHFETAWNTIKDELEDEKDDTPGI